MLKENIMETIFNKETRDRLIKRIHSLNENNERQWGKMNVYQMMKHCTLWDEMMQSQKKYKRPLVGLLFGRMALKKVLKDEAPLRHSTPTLPALIIKETSGDFNAQKRNFISSVNNFEKYSNPGFVHVFFGRMTEEQIGQFVYKHIDHHLRQFNC